MTIREFVAIVKENLNSVSLDDTLSNEYIYLVGVNFAKLLIKRETESRKIFKNTSVFKKICIPMKEVNSVECGISFDCKKIMRSKKKLPKGFLTNFGSLLIISNILRDKDYKETSLTAFKNIQKQKFKSRSSGYYWLEDDFLYIPNSEVEDVIGLGLFTDPEEVLLFENNPCGKILDFNFPCPDYFHSTIIELTINQLLARKKIPKDEDSNLNNNLK